MSGIATFKAAEDVRAVIRTMPADRIIVETDCPYLAPVPHRGRRNEPAYVGHVLRALADIRGWSVEEAEIRTTEAFFNLFDRIPEAGVSDLEITILGCGSSGGVPRGDGDWGSCNPSEPKNLRTRCSMLARRRGPDSETSVLIDTSPDLRQQMLAARATRVDAVLITHDHADQTHGIDDLRVFALRRRQRIPAWMDAATTAALTDRFDYIFGDETGYPAILEAQEIPAHGIAWQIDGPGGAIPVMTFDQGHGPIRSVGYRLGGVSYSSDVDALDEDALRAVRGSELWIIDALRWTRHPTHAHVDLALEWIAAARRRYGRADESAYRSGLQCIGSASSEKWRSPMTGGPADAQPGLHDISHNIS